MVRTVTLLLMSVIWLVSSPTSGAWSAQQVAAPRPAAPTTYYVSSSAGSDSNNGTSQSTPFETIEKVNSLELLPGDSVRFQCGDVWRTTPLVITQSGAENSPITFGSYPEDCDNQPVLTGAQPVTGWAQHSGNIYVADLSAGDNAARFTITVNQDGSDVPTILGVNQLFRGGERLLLGRWPNLDTGDGYSLIDSSPDPRTLVDNELPSLDWSGVVVHVKAMRWLILNRVVASSSGPTLTLLEDTECWGGCGTNDEGEHGWGYFLNNHLNTLDQDGEWYYDEATTRVYLYSASGTPESIEGSVILSNNTAFEGGIVLGQFKPGQYLSHVVVENFAIQNWFANGITYPRNLEGYDHSNLTIRNNTISNVDAIGMNLATWVYQPAEGEAGWRGGTNLNVAHNTIEQANHFGIHTYSRNSSYLHNTVRNIGIVENLGKSGMGCGYSGNNCTENGDGIRLKIDKIHHSGFLNTFQYNHLERIGYCGFDIFGPNNTLDQNVIKQACFTKGDCGSIRTFGRNNFNDTYVYDLTISQNIIVDTIGNTDGANATYKPLFGMGIYIDHYSKGINTTGNTVIGSTVDGILYQNSTGTVTNNTLYDNNTGTMGRGQVGFYKDTTITDLSHNVFYGLNVTDQWTFARTLRAGNKDIIEYSDNNAFFQPYQESHIAVDGDKTLEEWQAYSGMDTFSTQNWFTLGEGAEKRSQIFYNDTSDPITIDLSNASYLNLERNAVSGSLTLQPFTSEVLVEEQGGISLEPDELVFAPRLVGTTSPSKTITIQNTSDVPLSINNLFINTLEFTQTHNCPGTLAAGGSCRSHIFFTPQQAGLRSATFTIEIPSSEAKTYTANLRGEGRGYVSAEPETLLFGTQPISTTSPTRTITLRNTSGLSLTVAITVTGEEFSQTNNCPPVMASNAACTIEVVFTPMQEGVRRGSLTIQHNASDTPYVIALIGGNEALYLPMVFRR